MPLRDASLFDRSFPLRNEGVRLGVFEGSPPYEVARCHTSGFNLVHNLSISYF